MCLGERHAKLGGQVVHVLFRPMQKRCRDIDRSSGVEFIGTLHDFNEGRTTIRVPCSRVYAKRNDAACGWEFQQCNVQQERVPAADFAGSKLGTLVSDTTPRNTKTTANPRQSLTFSLCSCLTVVYKEGKGLKSLFD